jgi:hypothetical protein
MRIARSNLAVQVSMLVLALSAVVGCGQVAPLGATATTEQGSEARADAAGVAAQIARSTVGVDVRGTRVKQLPVPAGTKAVTFFSFKAMDNNLSSTLPLHLNILERAGSSANVNVVALVDGDGTNDTAKYYIRQDADEKSVTSPYLPVAEQNTGDGASLASAVKWAATSYPSHFRWVDLNDHGGGYMGICIDATSRDSLIRLPALAQALGAAGKIDLLTFDACDMATVEVGYELRNVAKVMVASEDDTYPLGMNYDRSLEVLSGHPSADAAALARDLVLAAQRRGVDPVKSGLDPTGNGFGKVMAIQTVSAIDLSKMDRVRQAVDQLSVALLAAMPRQGPAIKLALADVQPFAVVGTQSDHRDLHEIITQLAAHVSDPAIGAACKAVQATLFNQGGAIVMSRAANPEHKLPRGLAIYLPTNGFVDPIYTGTAFARETHWAQFLAVLK